MGPELVGLKANEWTYKRGIYETDSASVAGEIFSPAPAAPADRQGLCPFELCPRNVANILSQNARGNV